jgi:hypothetical protein
MERRKSAMGYSVKLTNAAIRKLTGWCLSSYQMREILKGFDALATHPARRLIRVGPPYDALYYDWVVSESGVSRGDVLYTFRVRYGVDEETLWIDDCDRMFDAPTA